LGPLTSRALGARPEAFVGFFASATVPISYSRAPGRGCRSVAQICSCNFPAGFVHIQFVPACRTNRKPDAAPVCRTDSPCARADRPAHDSPPREGATAAFQSHPGLAPGNHRQSASSQFPYISAAPACRTARTRRAMPTGWRSRARRDHCSLPISEGWSMRVPAWIWDRRWTARP
jgi:hypothetical protein